MIDKRLTESFYASEFASPDTDECKMQSEFMYKLQRLRNICGWPFRISKGGGYRTRAYNQKLGGADDSYHPQGMAADIDHQGWNGIQRHQFITAATALGFSVGIYDKHFHVDNRLEPRVLWIAKSK